jgi:hypothetical protein
VGGLEWKDCTSYSRGDEERKPTCFEIVLGGRRVVIVWGHRYLPGTWSGSIYGLIENYDLKLTNYSDIVQAKKKMLIKAAALFSSALKDCKEALSNLSKRPLGYEPNRLL